MLLYVFSISNITILIPLIFICNTLFTFFFFIELVSSCIFYKFILSNFNFKKKNSKNNFYSIFSKNYINVLFFQYWTSFFSSILIVLSIYNVFIICGSSDWSVVNFIINSENQICYFNNVFFYSITATIIFIGFIIK